jgi:hypothetical protein
MTGSRSGIEHAAKQLLHCRRYPQVWKRNESECYPGDDRMGQEAGLRGVRSPVTSTSGIQD